jgi:ubiquinone/menaquinone biosynthesis C-methylase UbiE
MLSDQDPSESPAIATETGADPRLTERFDGTERPLEYWVSRFEAESREVYVRRQAIVDALELRPGTHLADIGAGTGVFEPMLVEAVGAEGRIYAVDISPRFLEHLRGLSAAAGWSNVSVVEASEASSNLAPASVDVVFSVATYHHFTHAAETLASLRSALRPGGRLIIVDFERIPGESSEWVLGHVRADLETVRAEIEAAHFEFVRSIDLLEENYILEFVRP